MRVSTTLEELFGRRWGFCLLSSSPDSFFFSFSFPPLSPHRPRLSFSSSFRWRKDVAAGRGKREGLIVVSGRVQSVARRAERGRKELKRKNSILLFLVLSRAFVLRLKGRKKMRTPFG